MIIKIRAGLVILAVLLLSNGVAHAMPDAILAQFLQSYRDHGNEGVRDVARGRGINLREEEGDVLVPVIIDRQLQRTPAFASRLAQAGSRQDAVSRSFARLLVPVEKLEAFATVFRGERFRAPYPHREASGMGPVLSESVALTGADGYQAGNLTGNGVKVAVIDLGFSGLSKRISDGELPPDTVSVDFTGTSVESGTKHGTGVAEHVLDMAPGVELHCLKVGDSVDLQNAAEYLADYNIDIANHSVSWVNASYYDGTGPINAIVNDSGTSDGVFWTVASGNSAKEHWRGTWLDTDGDNVLEFEAGDEELGLTGSGSSIHLFLNWNQYGVNNKADLNLYLIDKAGTIVESSTTNQSRFNNPSEEIAYYYSSSQAPYHVRVVVAGGSASGLDVTLFSFNHAFDGSVASSSQMDPANATGAFSVGAVSRSNWQKSSPSIRSYSSRGPTTDGRTKPELVAPDGTSSAAYPTASGTSFSSPTVAGAAALLLEENPSRTASDLKSLLQNNAIDAGSSGVDNTFGHGKLQLPLIDSDSDGLNNVEEIALGTDALDTDSDDDGLTDYAEDRTWGTSPLQADTDGDGLNDYVEVIIYETDPFTPNEADLAPRGSPNDVIDVADYLILTRLVSGAISPTGDELTLGDLNDSGGLDAGDLVLMLQRVLPLPE